MKRTTVLLLTLFLTLCAMAQRGGQRVYFFQCQQDLGTPGLKPLVEEVLNLDPKALVSIDGRQVKVAVDRTVDQNELVGAMSHAGVGTFLLLAGTFKSLPEGGTVERPVYNDTGNPEADLAAYNAAKAAWLGARQVSFQGANNAVQPH